MHTTYIFSFRDDIMPVRAEDSSVLQYTEEYYIEMATTIIFESLFHNKYDAGLYFLDGNWCSTVVEYIDIAMSKFIKLPKYICYRLECPRIYKETINLLTYLRNLCVKYPDSVFYVGEKE